MKVNEECVEKVLKNLGFKLDKDVIIQKWYTVGQCSISLILVTQIVEEVLKNSNVGKSRETNSNFKENLEDSPKDCLICFSKDTCVDKGDDVCKDFQRIRNPS